MACVSFCAMDALDGCGSSMGAMPPESCLPPLDQAESCILYVEGGAAMTMQVRLLRGLQTSDLTANQDVAGIEPYR